MIEEELRKKFKKHLADAKGYIGVARRPIPARRESAIEKMKLCYELARYALCELNCFKRINK